MSFNLDANLAVSMTKMSALSVLLVAWQGMRSLLNSLSWQTP